MESNGSDADLQQAREHLRHKAEKLQRILDEGGQGWMVEELLEIGDFIQDSLAEGSSKEEVAAILVSAGLEHEGALFFIRIFARDK